MDNATRRQLLEQAKQIGYTGSILDVFQNPQVLDQFVQQQQQVQQQPQPQMQVEMPTPPATTPNYKVAQPRQSEAQPLVMSNTEVPIQIRRNGGPKDPPKKQREVVYTDPDAFKIANQAYRDSSDVYDLSQKVRVNPRNLPEIDKNTFNALNEKNRNLDPKIWAFDKVQYEEDKNKNNIKDFKDYMYEYPNFNNYQSLEAYKEYGENLRKISPQYNKNNPIKKETPNKIVKLKNGIERFYPTYAGEILDEGLYTDIYPDGTSRNYYDNELEGISAPNIKPISSKYYGKDEPEVYNKFDLSSSSTGWYDSGKKPKFKTTSNEVYADYYIPTDIYSVYKKPETKPVLQKTKPIFQEEPSLEFIEPKLLTKLPIPESTLVPYDLPEIKEKQTTPIMQASYAHRKGQYQIGENVFNPETKKWERKLFKDDEANWYANQGKIKKTGGILYENGGPTPKYANANALYNSSKYNSVSEKTDVGKFNSVKFIPYDEAPLDLSGNDSFEIGDEHLYQGANFTVDDTGNFKLNKPEGKVKAITNKEEYYRMLNPDVKPVGYNVHEYSIGDQTFKNYGLVYDDPNKKVEPLVQPTVIPTPKVREVAINKTDYSNKLGQSANRKYRWDPNLKKYQEVLETGGKKCYTCNQSKLQVLYNKRNYKK